MDIRNINDKLLLNIMIFFCFFIILYGKMVYSNENTVKVTKEHAIKIAKDYLKNKNFSFEKMVIEIQFSEKAWNKCLPKDDNTEFINLRKKKLEGHKYWFVYFFKQSSSKGSVILGGDICIFIDSYSGEVLTDYFGE